MCVCVCVWGGGGGGGGGGLGGLYCANKIFIKPMMNQSCDKVRK